MGTGEVSHVCRCLGGCSEHTSGSLLSSPSSGLEPLHSAEPEQAPPELEMTLHPTLAQGGDAEGHKTILECLWCCAMQSAACSGELDASAVL